MAVRWTLRVLSPIFIVIFYLTSYVICAKEVMLLDSTKYERLTNWTTHKNGANDTDNQGWREGSFLVNGQPPLRVFSSCYVSSSGVDNWLRTPFIDCLGANRITIEIEFSMRKCDGHTNPSSIKQCKETFNLYYYEADWDMANSMMPTWDDQAYNKIGKIAAEALFEGTDEIIINNEKRGVSLTRGLKGVYIAFQDLGACVTIISLKVYYTMCPNITNNYAFFMETATGDSLQALEEREGQCVANAVVESKPTYLCRSDGIWTYPQGKCHCLPGYEGHGGTDCVECQPEHYKWSVGNHACTKCPAHSYTNVPRSVECICNVGYYKSSTDDKNAPCTQPPSAPLNLRATVSHNSISLTWSPPLYDGGRTDIKYKVECDKCDSSSVFPPGWQNFIYTTNATISGLRSSTTYMIKIYAQNGVTQVSGKPAQYTEGTYLTKTSMLTITHVHQVSVTSTKVVLRWHLASDLIYSVDKYQVKWYQRWSSGDVQTNYTYHQNYTFANLEENMEYSFQIRVHIIGRGWSDFTDSMNIRTVSPTVTPEVDVPKLSVGIIIAAVLAVVVCMGIATVMIIILIRRNRRDCQNETKGGGDYDPPYNPGEVVHCPPLEPHLNGGLHMPLFPPGSGQKTYVDPHTYEDPNQAVREFTREIDASHITIESVIGGGEFGDVCKGKLRIPHKPEMTVAIKTLKPGATDKNRLDFLTEASIMGQFDDPNVIFLEGVVTKSHPIMIVTEYMENGSLDTFLRNNDGKFTIIQLVGMMRGISSGMRYLSDMGYVHRDLAARNILTNCNLVCKVADFGLSREIDIDTTDGAYTTKGGKIPVRWTAPEAIAFRKFTSSSDVWSYGVLMWEVISYGERPYWNWSNQDVIRAVDKGYRLPPPMDCPEAIHQLMLDCWQKERGNRPKFDTIVRSLDKFIRAPELLRKIAKPRPEHLMDTSCSLPVREVSHFTNVEGWLISIKMEKYIDNFIKAGYQSIEQVLSIQPRDLEQRLGVTLIGHQKKIMNSIQTMRAQQYGHQFPQMSEGFLV